MKHTALAAIALTTSIAVGATTITVEGVGADRESAKRDAFRTAIENVCGTVVLSDREHFNSRTTHNNVTTYSSCRVERYHIISESDNNIKMSVTVTKNRISERLLQDRSSYRTNQPDLQTKLSTYREEKVTGDRLVDEVFRDYPQRAYNVVSHPEIIIDGYRDTYLVVPYEIRWNYNFIKSITDTFYSLESKDGPGYITVEGKDPKAFLIGRRDTFNMDDLYRLNYIKSKFVLQNEMRLQVKARDSSGKTILNICYNPEYKAGGIFFSVGVENRLNIFGNDVNAGNLRIKLTFPAEVIYDTYVSVVPQRDCKL
jgi:hypothetical protein